MVIIICLGRTVFVLTALLLCYSFMTTTTTTAFTATVGRVLSKTSTTTAGNSISYSNSLATPFLVVDNRRRRRRINNNDLTSLSPARFFLSHSTTSTRLSTTTTARAANNDNDNDNDTTNIDNNDGRGIGFSNHVRRWIPVIVGMAIAKAAGRWGGVKAFVISNFFVMAAICSNAVIGERPVVIASTASATTTVAASSPPVTTLRGGEALGTIQESIAASILKKELLALIPKRPFDGPATNRTTSSELCTHIGNVVDNLELLTPLPPLARSNVALQALNGEWQLRYSDASEITRITQLPLGFRLGPVYQPLDVVTGRFENQALIKHKFRLCSGHTRVVADFFLAPLGDTNRVGVINTGERANVCFLKIIFTLRRFLFVPTLGLIRKTAIPNGPAEQAGVFPSIDITYLDETMRIARGGDGSVFVLTRPFSSKYQPMPMLSKETAENIVVDPKSPTYDASIDLLPSGKSQSSEFVK